MLENDFVYIEKKLNKNIVKENGLRRDRQDS